MRIIKKYPNRRLYDTTIGAYITLTDIKKLVFERIEFQVIDARTKKDLTQNTLLQIITEEETSQQPIFTTAMLQDFIRFYNEHSQHLLSQYLQQSLELFHQQKNLLKSHYEKLMPDPSLIENIMTIQEKFWSNIKVNDKNKTNK